MSNTIELQFNTREKQGTSKSRACRLKGEIPAVVYGLGKENSHVSVPYNEVVSYYNKGGFRTKVIDLKNSAFNEKVVVKDIHLHPVTDIPLHIDFLRVNEQSRINVEVPVRFINHEKSPGLKRGGKLNIVSHRVKVVCTINTIPSHVTADLAGLKGNDRVTLKTLKLSEGVEIGRGNVSTVCTVLPAKGKAAAESAE